MILLCVGLGLGAILLVLCSIGLLIATFPIETGR